MLQLIAAFLPIMAIVTAIIALATKLKQSRRTLGKLLHGFDWCVANSPAQVAFFVYSVAAAIAAGVITGAFTQKSAQWILSLEILFFISSLLLVSFHRLKLYSYASC